MYIAIDGGGTKTEYLLYDQAFQVVGRFVGGGSNHERLADGFEGVQREFAASTSQLLARCGFSCADVRDVVAGLSGADNSAQVRQLEDVLHRAGFVRVLVCNDGYLPVMAECEGGTGIAYNCGTGVCCTAIDSRGTMIKLGGLDEWSDDAGGGAWLLTQIFRSVYDDAALGLRATAMTAAYAQILGIAPDMLQSMLDESLPRVKEDGDIQKKLIASFFAAYDRGDAAAAEIGARMIVRAADYIGAAYRRSAFDAQPVQIVLAGSILLKAASETYLSAFRAAVEARMGYSACWVKPAHTAAHGAAVWLAQRNAQA